MQVASMDKKRFTLPNWAAYLINAALFAAFIIGGNAVLSSGALPGFSWDGSGRTDWTAASLAVHTQAVLQGAFILAKATGDGQVARDSVDHLARYVRLLFESPDQRATEGASAP